MKKTPAKLVRVYYRELAIAAVCFSIFAVILLFAKQLLSSISAHRANSEQIRASEEIKADLDNVSRQRQQLVDSRVFINPISRNNLLDVLVTAQAESKKRNVDIIVTDKDGFVMARSHLPGQRGDNIFQTTNHGHEIAKGDVITAAVRGGRSPLVLMSGAYIYDNGKRAGGIITSHALNDAYALNFKKEHLKRGEQIVFYTAQEGVVGDSLENKDKTRAITDYFSLRSNKNKDNLNDFFQEIRIGSDYYIVRSLDFPVDKEPNSGAFILSPVNHNFYALLLAASTVLLFLVLLHIYFFFWLVKCSRRRKWILFLLLTATFIIVYLVSRVRLDSTAIRLSEYPYLIYNSTIKFSPESDIISQSSEKVIAIQVLTGGESINIASAVVKYDPQALKVIDIQTTKTFCDPSLFLEKEVDKAKGEIRITCLSPGQGFSGASGVLAELVVRPLGSRPISLKFTDETQILANDGLGTNVLRKATDGYYQVINQKSDSKDKSGVVAVFSSSHPNSNRWYKSNDVKLSWPKISGASYYYSIGDNQKPAAEDKISVTNENELNISLADGIHYFYVQSRIAKAELGAPSSFKIMIDSRPPTSPKIKTSATEIKKGGIVRLDFDSSDELSGLQSGFYAKTNGSTFFPVKPPFYIPLISAGDYKIVIRAYDKADNFSDSSVNIRERD